jgi:Uma2 family endonuclease
MSGTEARRHTYADLAQFPEGDGKRYEIIDGELFVTPSSTRVHQRLVLRLARALDDFVDARGAEPTNPPNRRTHEPCFYARAK